MRPSVRRFFQLHFNSSKRAHAASILSTVTPILSLALFLQHHSVASVASTAKLTNVSETLGLVIAVVVAEALVLLGAVVPGQLEDTLALRLALALLEVAVGQEEEGEVAGLVLADQRHAQDVLVELERLFVVLDAEHRVVLHPVLSAFFASNISEPNGEELLPFYRWSHP